MQAELSICAKIFAMFFSHTENQFLVPSINRGLEKEAFEAVFLILSDITIHNISRADHLENLASNRQTRCHRVHV